MSSDVSASCTSRSAAHKPRAADLSAARAAADAPPALPARPRRDECAAAATNRVSSSACLAAASAAAAVAAYNAPIFASDVCALDPSRRRRVTHGLRSSQYGMCALTFD